MRFLVVDGDRGHGQAVGAALGRLGHRAVVVCYVGEVPESLGGVEIDAVLVGIETPAISGLGLAHEVAVRAPLLPIGFLAGRVTDPAALDQTSLHGPVLTAAWTDADLLELVRRFEQRR